MRYALLSVSDKTGLEPLARALVEVGYRLLSSGGTARALRDVGLEATPVEEVTGFPECLDGRVKTLHPRIHGGILFRRGDAAHEEAASALEMPSIEVVVCNLYPFEEKALSKGLPLEQAIELVDIGGPSMIRSAAKNWEHVAALVDPADYPHVIDLLAEEGSIDRSERRSLAAKAFLHTARYDALIAAYFRSRLAGVAEETEPPPEHLVIPLDRVASLRYGENPHQPAAVYGIPGSGAGVVGARQVQGKALSYNNLLDLDGAWSLAAAMPAGSVVVVKHTNPCGAAWIEGDLLGSWERARACDPVSAFGGIVALRGCVEAAVAEQIASLFLEIVAAPSFSEEALGILARKKNLRVMEMAEPAPEGSAVAGIFPWAQRSIAGGMLVQAPDRRPDLREGWKVVTKRSPSAAERRALELMWTVCRHVKSNAIVCGDDRGTTAVGAGQMSRVDAVHLCGMKARLSLRGSVAASDAFFPFRDGVDALHELGITAVIQPGGSIRDPEVIGAADELGTAMILTGRRHFRH